MFVEITLMIHYKTRTEPCFELYTRTLRETLNYIRNNIETFTLYGQLSTYSGAFIIQYLKDLFHI